MFRQIGFQQILRVLRFTGLCVCLALIITACRDSRARVIFDNRSECGTIAVQLTNSETGEVLTDRVPINTTKEIEVKPDVFYDYKVDFTAGGRTADNARCTAVEEGKVRVPAGTAQTFTLESQRQTAAP